MAPGGSTHSVHLIFDQPLKLLRKKNSRTALESAKNNGKNVSEARKNILRRINGNVFLTAINV